VRLARALALALAFAAPADAAHHKPASGVRRPASGKTKPEIDVRGALREHLAAETEAIAKALTAVGDKLAVVDDTRGKRVRAAMRLLDAPPGDEGEQMAAARRRAAARLLLERDASERNLLADEASRLAAARATVAVAGEQLPGLALPAGLAPPVAGTIARPFGPFEHDRSRAQLSRRGIDFEVDEHAPVTAPADGIVRYAGPIRGLDHGVILDHGDYVTVLGKLGDLALPVGMHLARGTRIGRAARHRVYFEVRVKLGPGGLPIDPEPLLLRADPR